MAAPRGGTDLSRRQAVRATERHYVGPPLRDDRLPPARLRLRAADAERHAVNRLPQRQVPPVGESGMVHQAAPEERRLAPVRRLQADVNRGTGTYRGVRPRTGRS